MCHKIFHDSHCPLLCNSFDSLLKSIDDIVKGAPINYRGRALNLWKIYVCDFATLPPKVARDLVTLPSQHFHDPPQKGKKHAKYKEKEQM